MMNFIADSAKDKSENEADIQELELRLTQLMVTENVEGEAEQGEILEEIRVIKRKIDRLR